MEKINKDERITPAKDEQPVAASSDQKASLMGRVGGAFQKAKIAIAQAAGHENTKAAIEWSKNAAEEIRTQATDLGQDIAKSDLGKTSLRGAAVGAVAAVPIPVIGPITGAVVGAGIGAFLNLKYGVGHGSAQKNKGDMDLPPHPTDEVLEDLRKLNALHRDGAITDEEFEELKSKMMKRF